LPEQPYKTLEDLSRHVHLKKNAPNDTPDCCEVDEDLWGYINGADPANEHCYQGLRVFKTGTMQALLKQKSLTTAQVSVYEDRKNEQFTQEQAIDLLQTKIESLKQQKK
jgi:hypothetical protein